MSANFSKWELVQDEKWPFRIRIMSRDHAIISQDRWAYSSKDKSLDDVMNAVHFEAGQDREDAALANKLQLDALRLAAAAPELLEALEALSAWTESTKCKREIGGLVHYKLLVSCKAAIAKARVE